MSVMCEARSAKTGFKCLNTGTKSIQHDDHIHNVCGPHHDKWHRDQKVQWFLHDACEKARKALNHENLAAVQQVMELPNTDGLAQVAKIKEEMEMPKKIYTCNEVGCTNFEKMTAEDHLHHMINEHAVRAMLTGHAVLENEPKIKEQLVDLVTGLKQQYGPRLIIVAGGCLGADWLWAQAAYINKVPYEIYAPRGYGEVFILQHKPENTRKWEVRENGRELLARWYKMLELASGVFDENGKVWPSIQGDHKYIRGANFRRNTTMVRVSQIHVAVSKQNPINVIKNDWRGGTYHCIREMKKLGVQEVLWIPATSTIKALHTIHINEEA